MTTEGDSDRSHVMDEHRAATRQQIRDALIGARRTLGYTRSQAALSLGVKAATYGSWERDRLPPAEIFMDIAAAWNVPIAALFPVQAEQRTLTLADIRGSLAWVTDRLDVLTAANEPPAA